MAYQLTVRIPVEAVDDVEARQKARSLINGLKQGVKPVYLSTSVPKCAVPENAEYKFQRIYPDKPPKGVSL